MKMFWVVSALANFLFGLVVMWFVTDAGDGFLGRDYQPAVLPILGACAIGIAVRLLGRSRSWIAVPVLCIDMVELLSLLLAVQRWPSGDDGRGIAFLLIAGGMLSAIVLADGIAAATIATNHWPRRRT